MRSNLDVDKWLKRSQKNALYRLITEAGMNPGDFEWRVYEGFVFRLTDENDRLPDGPKRLPNLYVQLRCNLDESFWFGFALSVVGLYIDQESVPKDTASEAKWCPTPNGRALDQGRAQISRFEDHLEYFRSWVETVRHETEQPDLWRLLSGDIALANAASNPENAKFSPEEQATIASRLSDFYRNLIESQSLAEEQSNLIRERIEYLIESSSRLGKKDWYNVALGALAGLVAGGIVSSEVVRYMVVNQAMRFALYWNRSFGTRFLKRRYTGSQPVSLRQRILRASTRPCLRDTYVFDLHSSKWSMKLSPVVSTTRTRFPRRAACVYSSVLDYQVASVAATRLSRIGNESLELHFW